MLDILLLLHVRINVFSQRRLHNVVDHGVPQATREELVGNVGHVINSLFAKHSYLKTLYNLC